MLFQQGRNIFGTFRVKTDPSYVAESKNSKRPYCRFFAVTKSATDKENTVDLEYEVFIFGDAAIPAAATILRGAYLLIGGRSVAEEYFTRDKTKLFTDFWFPIIHDPYHYVDILSAQMQLLANQHLGNLYRAIDTGDGNDNQL